MSFPEYFPVFSRLDKEDQKILMDNIVLKNIKKGTVIHDGGDECLGLLVIRSGMLRAYMLSDQGREITLYRLFERDVCLFTALCMMNSIQFDMVIEAEKDTEAWVIPVNIYQQVIERSAVLANYANEIMGTHFTDVMWLMEQIMWKSFDKRLASFLLEESAIEGDSVLNITHEQIASHMGTAREVVTRMLKYFQNEGYVKLTRGHVEITDSRKLYEMNE